MSREVLNPFTDIPERDIPATAFWGSDVIENGKSFAVGAGDTSFKVDNSGMWLGSDQFATAPFRVDMTGHVWATNVDLTQYVANGGAASDINSHSTTVNGSKLTAGTVVADYVVANISITTPAISGGTITGSSITIGSGIQQFKANSGGLLLGDPANPSFFVNMSGVLYAKSVNVDGTITARSASVYMGQPIDQQYIGNLSAGKITTGILNAAIVSVINLNASNIIAGTLNGSLINVVNLNAANINTGTLYVGGTGISGIYIYRSGGYNDARLMFDGGSRMWSDTSNRIGINSIGSPMYIYVGSSERLVIPNSGQTTIRGGVYSDGNFNMVNGSARFSGSVITEGDVNHNNRTSISIGGNQINIPGGSLYLAKGLSVYNTTSLYLDGSDPKVSIGGYTKTAILPTTKGYRALYCVESPEVWFEDYCYGERKNPFWMFWNNEYNYHLDPLFREVAVPPYHFMPTMQKGVFKVAGRRIRHNHKRFEQKSKAEYLQNERFLSMAKLKNKHYN